MDGRRAVLPQQFNVKGGAVALVPGELILRVAPVQLEHEAVPADLGENRRAGDAHGERVALDDGAAGDFDLRGDAVAVDEAERGGIFQPRDGLAHGKVGRLQNIDFVDGRFVHGGDAVIGGFADNHVKEGLSLLFAQLLGIVPIDVKEYSESQGSNIPVAYTDMQIYDFDSDGSDEIIASYLNLSEISATAKLIECHRGVDDAFTMSVTDTVQLDGHVLSYAEAKVAKLTDDRVYGVVLDGYKDNSTMITEYIYWNSVNGDLEAPFYNDEEQAVTVSLRSVNITSRDIDSDGVVDIPVTEFLPGYDNTSEAPMYLTLWYNADFGAGGCSFQSKKKNIINLSEGYSVTWQNSWEKKVTCRLDEKNRTLYFYHYQKDRFAFSDELFRIRVFTHDEWKKDRHDPDNTVVLNETDESVCAAILSGNQDLVDRRIIEAAFSLI